MEGSRQFPVNAITFYVRPIHHIICDCKYTAFQVESEDIESIDKVTISLDALRCVPPLDFLSTIRVVPIHLFPTTPYFVSSLFREPCNTSTFYYFLHVCCHYPPSLLLNSSPRRARATSCEREDAKNQ